MSYFEKRPCLTLQPFVESFWHQEAPAEDARERQATRVVPGVGVELIVCFADPFEHLEDGRANSVPSIQAAGQRTHAVHARATGRTGMVIARCYPWAAAALLGRGCHEMLDAFDDRGEADGLQGLVVARTSPAARIAAVEAYLLGLFRQAAPDPLVVAATARINQSWGRVRIRDLAREMALSRRQMQRRFARSTGVTPKRLARLVRYQKALGCLRLGQAFDEVVERCDYVDQGHLIGELKQFTGLAPGAVTRRVRTPLQRFYNSSHLDRLHNTVYL